VPPFSKAFPQPLPRNGPLWYRPKVTFTRDLYAGQGATNPLGDTRIGRTRPIGMSLDDWRREIRKTAIHEAVHRFLAPKIYLLRELRIYLAQQGLRRSYFLRYCEEALAETLGVLGSEALSELNNEKVIAAVSFPIQPRYELTFAAIGNELKTILLGPVVVGQMIYNVYYGVRGDDQ
jgi:hypothetical protein